MRLIIMALVLLSGCAAEHVSVYKPTISEKMLSTGKREVTVQNPYAWKLPVNVECVSERDTRHYDMEPGSSVVFTVQADMSPACSTEK